MNIKLIFKGKSIEMVYITKYLGMEFSNDGNTGVAKSDLYKRALKACFKLTRALKPLPTPSTSLHLFDHLIKPILLYGCEVWSPIDFDYKSVKLPQNEQAHFRKGLRDRFPFITKYMDKIDQTEKLHMKFCKIILGVHSKSSNLAVYSELGRYPLFIDQIIMNLKYIKYIQDETNNGLLKKVYASLMNEQKLFNNCSLLKMKYQLNNLTSNIFTRGIKEFYKKIKIKLSSCFNTYWHAMLYNDIQNDKRSGNKLRTYRKFKDNIFYEKYLNLNKFENRKIIAQFRTSAHKLKIETDRFTTNNNTYIPPEQRLCNKCNMKRAEDEYHFMLECPLYSDLRNNLYAKCSKYNQYFTEYEPNEKFIWIFTMENIQLINHLGDFLHHSFKLRNEKQ
jgi:hypothetical protein